MIYLYDTAILEKFKKWFNNPKMTISGDTKALFTSQADINEIDSFPFPLIGITRADTIGILETNKKPKSFRAQKYELTADETQINTLNAIPINLAYQVDIYTRHRVENDNILRELIFKLINNPSLEIDIPNSQEKTHRFNMRIRDTVTDNSDIPEHLIKGEYFRTTIDLFVDDAYLFEYKGKDVWMLDVGTELVEDLNTIKKGEI